MKQFLIVCLILGLNLAQTAQAEDRQIVVNGVAERALDPNMVSIQVEVWSRAATAKQAQGLAAQEFKNVKKVFDDFKIKKEDIQTDNYSLNPEYSYGKNSETKLVGYRVSQSMIVVVRKVDDAGNVLDALVMDKKSNSTGVNVNSVVWDSDKRSQAEIAALGDAVRAARVKADEIAKAANVKIKSVSKISHSTSNQGPVPMERNFAVKAMADSAPATVLAGGQVKVQVEVVAEYLID